MNRRAFLGFACGGVVAAPAALLVGEQPSASELIHGEILPLEPIAPSPLTVEVIKGEVQRAVNIALHQAEVMRQRGYTQRG